MIEKDHPKHSLRKQCELLKINRNRLAQGKSKVSEEDEQIMKDLDVIYTNSLENYQNRLTKLNRALRGAPTVMLSLLWEFGK